MGDLTAGLLEIWLGASIVSAFCNLALALGREGVRGGGHFSWELRHRGGVNHQAGTEAKTARRKLGLWPRLRALGSIQLDGAMPAGPDVESHRVAGDCLTAGERDKEQTDMTIQRVEVLPSTETLGPWSARKGTQSIGREQRGFLEEGVPVC